MKDSAETSNSPAIARKLPAAGTKNKPAIKETLKWEGRSIPMLLERGMWRLRTRSKFFSVDINLGALPLSDAKKLAKEKLAALPAAEDIGKGTLAEVVSLYKEAPKRCNSVTAEGNVSRLKQMVKIAWGKTLREVPLTDLPNLWPAYVAKRQGLPRPDYATRRSINTAINAGMRQASSIFMETLRPFYRRNGVIIPSEATTIMWAAEGTKVQSEAKSDDLIKAWSELRHKDVNMWLAVGLARFAGLRRSEILGCRGKWIIVKGATTYVQLKDREEDNYWTKTGRSYMALIVNSELAEYLKSIETESPVIVAENAERWLEREPQVWLRPFTGGTRHPLHRLRGLYADHIKQETEAAILARQEAIKEASKNLGHTTTTTTEAHYLTPDDTMPS